MKSATARTILALLGLLTFLPAARGAYGAPAAKPVTEVVRFAGAGQGVVNGRRRSFAALEPLNGRGFVRAYVPFRENTFEPDTDISAAVTSAKPGDVLKVDLVQTDGYYSIKKIEPVEVKPGEETPHGYVFQEAYDDPKTNEPTVRLTKYGESLLVTLPIVRGEKGKPEIDSQVQEAVQKFKSGDVVYVQLAQFGRAVILTGIYPYKEPQTGKLTKISDVDLDGQKAPAVEIASADGQTVTALIPGRLNGKRWSPDINLLRAARALRPGTDVQYVTRDDNGKTVLLEISKAPPTPKAPAAPPVEKQNTAPRGKTK